MTIVSIIIPTKNSSATLPKLLYSISMQNFSNLEIIIVDNYSHDSTIDIASKWGARIFVSNSERSSARNFGARMAKGAYLLFLDSDMFLRDPNVVSDSVELSIKNGYGACVIREISAGVGYWANVRTLERQTYEGGSIFETAVFFKKNVFLLLGGFNEKLVGFEDYDLQARIEKNHVSLGYSNTPIIHDEGKLILAKHLMKKRYYVQTGKRYIFNNKNRSLSQFIPIKKEFIKNWRKLKAAPLYAIGLVFLKSLEIFIGCISVFV